MTDTPQTAAAPQGLSRRALGQGLFAAAAAMYTAALAWPIFRYLKSGTTGADEGPQVNEVNLGAEKDYLPGSGKLFLFGSKPALILRRKDGHFVALFATCTHLGCTVKFAQDQDRITCACHGGVYDPDTGRNIGGPPPAPLKPLVVSTDGGAVVVRRA